MRRAAAFQACASLALLACGACHDRAEHVPTPVGSVVKEPDPAASARRPARRYYLGRTASRCEIYRVDDTVVSPSTPTPCPADLQIGERIRIAGKTCMRESSVADRVEPTVCPDPLTNREKRDLGLIR
ncbi:Hypothetical protein A7982_08723 [Minicystis rosea]|nr:Hypothetical protein A7982_08723 [Minicystis rosea]